MTAWSVAACVLLAAACTPKGEPVPVALLQHMTASDPVLRQCAGEAQRSGEESGLSLRVTKVELGGTGLRHYFLTATAASPCLCGNRRCPSWIVQEKDGTYTNLQGAEGVVQDASSNGLKDVLSEEEVSDGEEMRILYQFDGHAYRPRKCWVRDKFSSEGFEEAACL